MSELKFIGAQFEVKGLEDIASGLRDVSRGVDKTSDKLGLLDRKLMRSDRDLDNFGRGMRRGAASTSTFSTAQSVASRRLGMLGTRLCATTAVVARFGFIAAGVATAGVVGLGGVAVKSAVDLDFLRGKLEAVTGISEKQSASLVKNARDLARVKLFTPGDVLGAEFQLLKAGFSQSQVELAVPAALDLSVLGETALPEAVDSVTASLKALNLEAGKSGDLVNAFASAQAQGNADISILSRVAQDFLPIVPQLGLDVAESFSLMTAAADVFGIKAGPVLRNVGLTFQEFSQRLSGDRSNVLAQLDFDPAKLQKQISSGELAFDQPNKIGAHCPDRSEHR